MAPLFVKVSVKFFSHSFYKRDINVKWICLSYNGTEITLLLQLIAQLPRIVYLTYFTKLLLKLPNHFLLCKYTHVTLFVTTWLFEVILIFCLVPSLLVKKRLLPSLYGADILGAEWVPSVQGAKFARCRLCRCRLFDVSGIRAWSACRACPAVAVMLSFSNNCNWFLFS